MGDVSLLPQEPDLPCEQLWEASVVEQDARLIVTGGRCEGRVHARVWTLDTISVRPHSRKQPA